MQAVQVYGLRRCSTCVKARKWLDAKAIGYTFIDYRDDPVEPAILSVWASKLGWQVVINRASAPWRALSDEQKTTNNDEGWLALIAQHPTLVKRPVLVKAGKIEIGFSEARYEEFFK